MAVTDNPGRERILRRIHSALATPRPERHTYPHAPIFAPVANPVERFRSECKANNTECMVVDDVAAALATVGETLKNIPGEIFLQDTPWLRRMASEHLGGRELRWSSSGAPRETSQACITLAESLVAASGSVFVSAECGGRGASVVAPVHIIVATADQLTPSLDAAFQRMRERGTAARNSAVCLITGPSRTGDIEKIIVMGAHGPRRLIVVLAVRE
jgi:L-lactate dehydrogenase complex protein LldG